MNTYLKDLTRTENTKTLIRANISSGRLHPLIAKYPIRGDYGLFIKSISDYSNYNSAATPLTPDLYRFDNDDETVTAIQNRIHTFSVNHARMDDSERMAIFEIIRFTVVRALQAVKALEADQYKNTGAGRRRRIKNIAKFKQAKSDYNLLLTSSRSALASTMQLRRTLQDTTEDQIKYINLKDGTIRAYESKIYIADFDSISNILNSDVKYIYLVYKSVLAATPIINKLVDRFNETIQSR